MQSDVSENGGARTPNNSSPVRKLANIVKINFVITLEANQKLSAVWEGFAQEKWLNLGKNRELYGFLTCPSPFPSPSSQYT